MANFRNTATGSITANGQSVAIQYRHFDNGAIGVQVTGTFVASMLIEGTIDGTTFVALAYLDVSSVAGAIAGATPITAAGIYRSEAVGFLQVRVRCTAYTSGTAVVTLAALAN